jgi:tRNA pseudouridine55 synthase
MKQTINGLLVLDKPSGMTSRDAVNQAMTWFPRRTRIGHTGTLDPLATGVLVLCLGRATRLAEFVQEMDKTYQSTFVLGGRSDTDDADGTITPNPAATPIERPIIEEALREFIGVIAQAPPRYSAVKIDGRRAHAIARKGEEFEIAPRNITIERIEVLDSCWPTLRLGIACGKGTYIRSLARDLGERLGVGAYVAQLRRTRVGPFLADDGVALTAPASEARARVRPPGDAVAELPRVVLDDDAVSAFCHGQAVATPNGVSGGAGLTCSVFKHDGSLIGVGAFGAEGALKPSKIVGPV